MPQYGAFTQNVISGSALLGSELSTFTFPSGGTTSTVIQTWGRAILALYLPNTVIGASWQIYGAYNDDGIPSSFFPYVNIAGAPVGIDVVTASLPYVVGLTPIEVLGLNFIQVVSDMPETNSPIIPYTLRIFS